MTETTLPTCAHCGHQDADHHCPECAAAAHGTDAEGFIPEDAEDSEGNPIGAVAPWDEWHSGDADCETLTCGDCGAELDTAHADPHSPECPEWEPEDEPEPELPHTHCPRGLRRDHEHCPADEHEAARMIAGWFHGGQGSALYAFASSGTILPDAADEAEHCAGLVAEPADADDVSYLCGYLAEHAPADQPEPTAPYRAGLVTVHEQSCRCPYCHRPAEPSPDLAELERAALARQPWPKTPALTRQHFAYVARILAELGRDAGGPDGKLGGLAGGGGVHAPPGGHEPPLRP